MEPQFLRCKDAGQYLKRRYGFGSERTVGKLACVGGGPVFRKAGSAVIYEPAALDAWALEKISEPRASSSVRGDAPGRASAAPLIPIQAPNRLRGAAGRPKLRLWNARACD
jgi:hypothetical protein